MIFFIAPLISGRGRGRHLGFPTLNLKVSKESPDQGVYAVRARFLNQIENGVMHVGPRPTFHEDDVSIEVHLLDFDGTLPMSEDLIEVEILSQLREVMTFDSPEALKKRIAQDIMQARSFF